MWVKLLHKIIEKARQWINWVDDRYIKLSCNCKPNTRFMGTSRVINLQGREGISIGSNSTIRGELHTMGHGGKITIGDDCYIGPNTYIWSGEEISIGNRVMISHNCNIFDNDTHPLDPVMRQWQYKEIMSSGQPKNISLNDKKIQIKDDVLICANVTILKGVTIGKGAVIGTNSLLTRDVPDYSLAYGNPAKIIKIIRGYENGGTVSGK